ncbi:MAG: arginine--tRNA ligase [Planctomycetota bacterium]|nr:arginine--tRNA ligase [Planctomycetota bacterium]
MNVLAEIKRRFASVLEAYAEGEHLDSLLGMIKPAQDARFGDYQANFAMPLGNQQGQPPREVAADIVEKVQLDDLCSLVEIAGPGFINLTIHDSYLAQQVSLKLADERLGISPTATPRTIVIDYSSPNVAKPMHVGHIRSTVIGDSLARTLHFLGHNVIRDNHLGDWGTQFGMIIYGYKHFVDQTQYAQHAVIELSRLYRLVNQLVDYHKSKSQLEERVNQIEIRQTAVTDIHNVPLSGNQKQDQKLQKTLQRAEAQLAQATQSHAAMLSKIAEVEQDPQLSEYANEHADIVQNVLLETAALHAGDLENQRLWKEFLPQCREDIQRIYSRLHIEFDVEYGESFYHEMLSGVVEDLREQGLARESEGAVCVFLDEFDAPMIVQKSDGAFLYSTTDLATIQYRLSQWQPDEILYVVDHRQSEHFQKLFAVATAWISSNVRLKHISFGTVLDESGRPYKTRSGDAVGLEGLLDEAVGKALEVVSATTNQGPDEFKLTPVQCSQVADVVGHGAIKYADLAHNRTSDYVFSYDKMMALEGNTATYMQYCYARVQSIFRRGGVDVDEVRQADGEVQLAHAAERLLALTLMRYSEALDDLLEDYRPNQLTNYLFELAKRFSSFFEQCPVLKAEDARTRTSRLRLCDLTARTISHGMDLLGIGVVQQM